MGELLCKLTRGMDARLTADSACWEYIHLWILLPPSSFARIQAVLLADQYMAKLRIKGYERQEVTAVQGSLGVTMTNTPGSGLLYVSFMESDSQLSDCMQYGDIVFRLDGQLVYNMMSSDMKKLVYDKRENATRVFEIWRRRK